MIELLLRSGDRQRRAKTWKLQLDPGARAVSVCVSHDGAAVRLGDCAHDGQSEASTAG